VLIEELPEPMHVAAVAQKILAGVVKPFSVGTHEFSISASIGISTYPDDSDDMLGLLKNAAISMQRAKEQGKHNYQFYSAPMNLHIAERLALESGLRRALERNVSAALPAQGRCRQRPHHRNGGAGALAAIG
jgi:predicted signal transduction protein with EAL and GGDEF domain